MSVQLRNLLLSLIRARGPGKTICPSEVARHLGGDWRARMPAVRDVAAELSEAGKVVVLQRGRAVNLRQARGPVRLGLPPAAR